MAISPTWSKYTGLVARPPGETEFCRVRDVAALAAYCKILMKTLVLGLGNPLLGDDAVGLEVVALVRARLSARDDVEVQQAEAGGLRMDPDQVPTQRTAVEPAVAAVLEEIGAAS